MSSAKTEIPFKNTLKDILKSHKILNKHSKASVTAKILLTVVRICLLVMTVYGSLFYFKEYYFLRKIIYKPLSETIGYFITGIFLSAVFVAGVFYFTALKNYKTKLRYRKDPYNNRTRLFTVSEGGITLSSFSGSRHFNWDKVTMLIEISHGLIISFSDSYVFIPSRYISAENIADLRKQFLKYIPPEKINFISRVSINAETEICEPFKVADLMGKPAKQTTADNFSFEDYLHMKLTEILFYNPDVYIISGITLLFVLLLSILTAKNIWLGLLCFIVISAVLLVIAASLVYIYIRRCYEITEKCSRRITFYGNAIYVETANSYSVLEYKHILSYREKSYSVTVMGFDTLFRISRENADELEKIKELIKRKTLNNKQQFNLS